MNADRRDEESNGGWQFDSSESQPRPRLRTAAEVADERVREIESGVKQLRPKLTLTPQHLLALGLVLLAILWPSYSIYRWHQFTCETSLSDGSTEVTFIP